MKEWIKNAVLFALAIFAVYGFMTIKQQNDAIGMLRHQTMQLNDALRQQCEQVLDRAGYVVQLTPKAAHLPLTPPKGSGQEPEKE